MVSQIINNGALGWNNVEIMVPQVNDWCIEGTYLCDKGVVSALSRVFDAKQVVL